MGTVDKALNLLSYFTLSHSQWGLSELARAAGLDKATSLRLLRSLEQHRMIEQDSNSKQFRLGTAFINLARVREQSFPLASVINKWLAHLAEVTGETAHASLAGENGMTTIAIAEPQRSTRVNVDPSELLPFHATASGIAYLAFGPEQVSQRVLTNPSLQVFTEHTTVDPAKLKLMVYYAQESGCAVGDQLFELETLGLAVPLFDASGIAQGAMAVASPTMRMTSELRHSIVQNLMNTTLKVAEEMGGLVPPAFRKLSGKHSDFDNRNEPAGTES